MDYPEVDPDMDCFVESVRDPKTGEIKIFTRPFEQLIPGDRTKA
jgi:adenylylsulfate reductase subunit A